MDMKRTVKIVKWEVGLLRAKFCPVISHIMEDTGTIEPGSCGSVKVYLLFPRVHCGGCTDGEGTVASFSKS